MAKLKGFPKPHGAFTYSVPVVQEFGRFPQMINKEEITVVVASVSTKLILLDPENPRTWHDEELKKGNGLSASGQKRIVESLTSGKREREAARLKASMEHHGGQNEVVWVQNRGGKTIVVEGNRRRALAEEVGWETMTVFIFPDQMSQDNIDEVLMQRHVAGIQEWTSAIRSEVAYRLYTKKLGEAPHTKHDIRAALKEIKSQLQFDTEGDAEKYIHSFVWLKESGLPAKDWSKMHHAYRKSLINHFGYNPETQQFNDVDRSTPKNCPSIEAVDEITAKAAYKAGYITKAEISGFKTNFQWFVNLIKTNRVTDCRHSDGIIGPALRDADKPYGPDVMRKLHSKPVNRREDGEIVDDGVGPLDHGVPAHQAWEALRAGRTENHLLDNVQSLKDKINDVLASATLLEKYCPQGDDDTDNLLLRQTIALLQTTLSKFLKSTERKSTDKAA